MGSPEPDARRHETQELALRASAKSQIDGTSLRSGIAASSARKMKRIFLRAKAVHPKSQSWKQVGHGYRFVTSWKFRKIANCEAVQFW
jgi:hypothetical protein